MSIYFIIILNRVLKAELYLLFVTLIWGLGFPIMKIGLEYIPTNNFLAYSYLIGAATFLLIFRGKCLEKDSILPGLVLGFSLYIAQGLQTRGLNYTTASHSAFITALSIIFAPIFASLILNEKLKTRNILLIFLSILGLYLLTNPLGILLINFGDFLTILSALSFGVEVVLIQKYTLSGEYSIYSLAFWQLLFSSFFYIIAASYVERWVIILEDIPLITILYTGFFATFLTSVFQYIFQRDTSIQRASVVYAAEPLFAYVSAFIILHETLDLTGYIGAFLILFSIILQEIKLR